MKDALFQAQWLRAVGYAPYGGADAAECLAVAERITEVDPTLWHRQWSELAGSTYEAGADSERAGHLVSARGAFLRASNYFRTAGIFLLQAPVVARLAESHRREVESFRRGAAMLDRPPELIEIPYEGSSLPGYFFRAGDGPRPTVVLTNGYDGSAEELYFTNGVAALERGYHVLAFDGPGQGSMILERGVPFRPDWENVVRPVVDHLLQRPDVDPGRIALIGLSFGGYLAPRAATGEHRLAACISDCGPYDLFQASVSRLPGLLARQLPAGNSLALATLNQLLRAVLARPTAGWALRRNLLVHGLSEPLEFFRVAPQYSLRGRESSITCPTFVCTTDADDLSAAAPELFAALTCPKYFVTFRAADGAGEHCESGARTAFHREAFDWLDAVLSGGSGHS